MELWIGILVGVVLGGAIAAAATWYVTKPRTEETLKQFNQKMERNRAATEKESALQVISITHRLNLVKIVDKCSDIRARSAGYAGRDLAGLSLVVPHMRHDAAG